MQTVRNRGGVGIDTDADSVDDLAPGTQIQVPTQDIKRICDQVGITTRALQVELDARGVTADDMGGVSDATYVNGQRVSYWVVTAALAEPAAVVHDAETAAEQAAQDQADERAEQRTEIGAVDSEHDDDAADDDPSDGDGDDYEPGLRDSLGTDPSDVDTDRGDTDD
jgi:hypothetical protein